MTDHAQNLDQPVNLRDFSRDDADPRRPENQSRTWPPGVTARRFGIQFTRPLTRDEYQEFKARGLVFDAYIPELTYIESIDEPTLMWLRQQTHVVNGIFSFEAKYKISPAIGQTGFETQERQDVFGQDRLLLRVVLFPEARIPQITSALEHLGATDLLIGDNRTLGGTARIEFSLPAAGASAAIETLAAIDAVRWIEEVPEILSDSGMPAAIGAGLNGLAPFTSRNLLGKDQIVAVYERGVFAIDHCWFADAPPNTPGHTHRKVHAYFNASNVGNSPHSAFVAGILAGKDRNGGTAGGVASDARIVYCNREDFRGVGTAATFYEYLVLAANEGARVHNTSWHSRPDWYSNNQYETDLFTWAHETNLVVGSSGKVPQQLGPPGAAWNALCVTAAYWNQTTEVACFANGGVRPNWDPRRKPDLLAPGCEIDSAFTPSVCDVKADAKISGDPPVTPSCAPGPVHCATSFATPGVAAAAALARQYLVKGWYPAGDPADPASIPIPDPSGALLKAILLNSTQKTSSSADYPDSTFREGWGCMQLNRALYFGSGPRKLWLHDLHNGGGMVHGDPSQEFPIQVASNAAPLKVTLVWTIPPILENNLGTLVVNDLDLAVQAPNDVTYFGNQFRHDKSEPGGIPGQRDNLNTVEMVLVPDPTPGPWKIIVRAASLPQMHALTQGFALVASGDITV